MTTETFNERREFSRAFLAWNMGDVENDWPKGEQGMNITRTKEEGKRLLNLSAGLTVMAMLVYISESSEAIWDLIGFWILYTIPVLYLAVYLTGVQNYILWGRGETREAFESIGLTRGERNSIRKIFAREYTPENLTYTFPALPAAVVRKLEKTIKADKKKGIVNTPSFSELDDIVKVWDWNVGYIAMFFLMGIVLLITQFVHHELSSLPLFILVAFEQIGIGLGTMTAPTRARTFRLGSWTLNGEFGKGMVGGLGFALWETYNRFALHGSEPFNNFLGRVPGMFLHMMYGAVFLCGAVAFVREVEGERRKQELFAAFLVMLFAVFVHWGYLRVVRWSEW